MADQNRQDKRIARLDTPLGPDKLVLSRFEGSEGMSEIFEFSIEALSRKNDVDADALLGKPASITFDTSYRHDRFFHGIVTEVEWTGVRNDNFVYRLVIKPWLWLLSFTNDCRIFHEMTAPDIIQKVFQERGFTDFKLKLQESYEKLEYTVQYRESDFDFVRRLMEQNGISFFFEHEREKHFLILADNYSAYPTVPGGTRPYIGLDKERRRATEHIESWTPDRRFTSGAVAFRDYDFKGPKTDMNVTKSSDAAYTHGQLEVYDYPGAYVLRKSEGQTYAKALLNSMRAHDGRFRATGDCITASPGSLLTLTQHFDPAQNKEYLILRCFHNYTAESYRSGGEGDESPYEGAYELMLASRPYAPPQVTPKPFVQGVQTAQVVGSGEIDVDEYGRIIVQFYWDRKSGKSMRCRLAQVWAGKNWGGIYIPRVGMEVIVQFLEGDPDRPIVIGCVYNADNMPPFDLPGQKNIAGIKSNSTTGGGGYNEYVFDDTKGKELIRQHGQFDLESVVENDERWTIHNDRTVTVDNKLETSVGKKKGGGEKREVWGDRETKIHTVDTIKVDSKMYIEVGGPAGSRITITPTEIKMEALNVVIEAGAQYKSNTILSEHKATGLMDIKGTLVKINS
ncbi:MAG: type VI secretion system tip protein VgrG [Rhizobiaceae bacterium]|nr:type VI secretion system tip protein VgrG [Rhizobiaceae bacterium]MCV0408182.1 type VI secretion system tip protein VgrG [Rhizobiaceae bacterium]